MARAKGRKLSDLRDEADAVAARARARGEDPEAALAEAAPAKAKKPSKKKAPGEAKPRKKTTKVVRKRVVWVVYDNAHKPIAKFAYTDKAAAEEKAEQMKTDKKQTYFVQPLKEEWPVE